MDEVLDVIIKRLVEDADEAVEVSEAHPKDRYFQGTKAAYDMVLNTIKNTLFQEDYNPVDFGLDMDLGKEYL